MASDLPVPQGYDPTLVDQALQAVQNFVPELERAKRSNIQGWPELERTMIEHYKSLMQLREDYHPQTTTLDV